MDSALSPILFAHNFIKSRSPRFAATSTTFCRLVNGSSWETKAFRNNDRNEKPLGGTDESFFDHIDNMEITPETVDFFVSDAKDDPDFPTQGYSSIELALQSLRQGKVLDRRKVLRQGSAKSGTSIGVSASDRDMTVLALASLEAKPDDFRKPGHVFPLKYSEGGVLRRAGHTEASVDLMILAGLRPVSVLSAILGQENGSIASLLYIKKLATEHEIPIVSLTDQVVIYANAVREKPSSVEKAREFIRGFPKNVFTIF